MIKDPTRVTPLKQTTRATVIPKLIARPLWIDNIDEKLEAFDATVAVLSDLSIHSIPKSYVKMNLLTKKSIKRFITFNYILSRFKKDNIGIKENFVFPFVYIFKNHKIVKKKLSI